MKELNCELTFNAKLLYDAGFDDGKEDWIGLVSNKIISAFN